MAPDELRLGRIGQIAVPVRDLDRAVAFYRDTLGMALLFQVPRLAFFDCAGVRLMLSAPEGAGAPAHASILYYWVENLEAAYTILVKRGARAINAPHLIARLPDREVWMAFFYDSEENTLALMHESPV